MFLVKCSNLISRTDVVKPALHDNMLAPTREQRLRFASKLRFWAKDKAILSHRQKALLSHYVVSVSMSYSYLAHLLMQNELQAQESTGDEWDRDESALYDVFEPTALEESLSLGDNLGHLIFGTKKGEALGGAINRASDPLTEYFRQRRKSHLMSLPL